MDVLKQCDQCRRKLGPEHFLKVKAGWFVTKCNDCAQFNMRVWQFGYDPLTGIIPATPDAQYS
jgi:hypothetical protein